MPIRTVIHGLERVSGKFASVARKFPKFLEDSTLKAVLYVHSKIPPYPPQNAGNDYRRTGTLGRTITSLMGKGPESLSRVENVFGSVKGIVGTRLKYAPWVIDKSRQTKSNKRNWWNLQDVVKGLRKGIKDTYLDALKTFLHREF